MLCRWLPATISISLITLAHTCLPALPVCPPGLECTPAPPAACLLGSCAKQQQLQSNPCGAGCSSYEICTQKGCTRRKAAHGVKTFQQHPVVTSSPLNPDARFLTCCQSLAVGDACMPTCTFDGFNKPEISAIFLMSSQCPSTGLAPIFHCAALGHNHTSCCLASNIHPDCLHFCDQEFFNFEEVDVRHLKCLSQFDTIRSCFYNHAIRDYYRQDLVV
ncbi:unnamed protein product, partial [Mesorhabditis spiculigera]